MQTVSSPAINKSTKRKPSHPALQIKPEFLPDLSGVVVSDAVVTCSFDDGRSVSFPLVWSQKLTQATDTQRQTFTFNAHFIFWDDIDEIIGVRNILFGNQLGWN